MLSDVDAGEPNAQGIVLPAQTRDELAARVMSTRESVSRTLGRWTREGIIAAEGRRIVVRDQNRLRRIVGEIDVRPANAER